MPNIFLAAALLSAPVCSEPSHDRLVIQPGRDVCGAALTAKGTPRAAGFLPTACADPRASYRIDAASNADVCVLPEARRA